MTTTTTIKLQDSLKERIAQAAAATGKSAHAFMVEALQAQTELAERRLEFIESARLAEAEVAQFGLVYDADEVFSHIQARLDGRRSERPKPTKLRP
ncbi:MAG: ribbon-helix-helix protein, CopG family [Thiobacillus sp.]|nr:ribbon-helix-helix protein, CopG family [Thiobacillus sp.]